MDTPDYGEALRAIHELAPSAVADSLGHLARRAGASDIVLYLADFEQAVLRPIPDRGAHAELPVGEPVLGTVAGEAFGRQRLISEVHDGGFRVWVPIIEGSDCTGVMALSIDGPLDDSARERCEELGLLAGCAIAIAARYTDLYNLVRRRRAMSLPASMQWGLLPPLRLSVPEVTSSAVLEPAYDVGGDCFDHAVNGFDLDVAIMDAVGHGLGSSLVSALAIGAYRHDRREGRSLTAMHQHLDQVIGEQFDGETFVTGQLARLALRSGELTWTNAGHPPPLLIRDGGVAKALECRPSLPWGLGGRLEHQAVEWLQPGDAVLFYTDGVTEGRGPDGEPFGLSRLHHLVASAIHANGPASGGVVHRLIDEVLDFQDRHLRDDATMVWVAWEGDR